MSSCAGDHDNSAAGSSDHHHEESTERNEESYSERGEEASRGPLSPTVETPTTSQQQHLHDQDKALELSDNSHDEVTSEDSQEGRQEEENAPSEESQHCVEKEQSLGINNRQTPVEAAGAASRESSQHPLASSEPKYSGASTHDEVVWVPGSLVVVQPEEQIPTAIAIDAEVENDYTLRELVPPTQAGQPDDDHPSSSHGGGGQQQQQQQQRQEQFAGSSPVAAPEMHPEIQIMSVVMDEANMNETNNSVPLVNADPVHRNQLKLSTLFQSRKLYMLMCLVILLTMMFTWGLEEFILWTFGNEDDNDGMVTDVSVPIDETGSTMESFVLDVLQIADPVALTNLSSPQYRALSWLFSDVAYVRRLPNFRRVQRYALATLCFSMMEFQTPEEAQDAIGWLTSTNNDSKIGMDISIYDIDQIHECAWPTGFPTSVVCRDERFIILHLPGEAWNLIGHIPPELALLTDLVTLNLSNNYLIGSIPTHVGLMSKLESLNVENNELTGPIPTEIGKLPALTRLHLPQNHLSSSLPSEIGQLNGLSSMDLHQNKLTGSIPEEIRFLNSAIFHSLDFHMNYLTGTIPSVFGDLLEFRYLDLSQNNFIGTIPTELGLLTHMNALNMYNIPHLSGAIPTELESMTSIDVLHLHNTSLNGTVPKGICNYYREDQLELFMISCSMVDCSCDCPCIELEEADFEYDHGKVHNQEDDFMGPAEGDINDDYFNNTDGIAAESGETSSAAMIIQPWLLAVGLGVLVSVTC